jgi:hypothetical protein
MDPDHEEEKEREKEKVKPRRQNLQILFGPSEGFDL